MSSGDAAGRGKIPQLFYTRFDKQLPMICTIHPRNKSAQIRSILSLSLASFLYRDVWLPVAYDAFGLWWNMIRAQQWKNTTQLSVHIYVHRLAIDCNKIIIIKEQRTDRHLAIWGWGLWWCGRPFQSEEYFHVMWAPKIGAIADFCLRGELDGNIWVSAGLDAKQWVVKIIVNSRCSTWQWRHTIAHWSSRWSPKGFSRSLPPTRLM